MGHVHKLVVGAEYAQALINDLQEAKASILFCAYVISFRKRGGIPSMMKIREILNSKIKEGLDVQIVVNQTGHDQKKKTFAMQYFGEANECGCVHYYPMGQYHHEKVVIIDKKIVYLGSHNLTSTSLCSFSEVSVRLDSEESAGILSNIINLWR